MDKIIKKLTREEAYKLIYQYYDLIMDDNNGGASEELIDTLLDKYYEA